MVPQQVPLEHVWGPVQTAPWQLPLLQMGVPPWQAVPHPPQLCGSTNGSLHAPLQQFSQVWHAGLQVAEPLELPLPRLEPPELLLLPLDPPLPPLLDVLPLPEELPPLDPPLDPPLEPPPLLASWLPASPPLRMVVLEPPHQKRARENAARHEPEKI